MGGAFYVSVDEKPGSPAGPGKSSVALLMTPEGHAQPCSRQALLGAKSAGENLSTDVDGRKSEKQCLLVTTSDHHPKQTLVPCEPWKHSNDDQLPQHVSGSSLSSSLQTSRVKGPDQPVQVLPSSPTAPTPPPILSDSSTKWTGKKLYRHATNSAVTFVDGNLDDPRSGGEHSSALKRLSKNAKSALSVRSSFSSISSTVLGPNIDNMPSNGFVTDDSNMASIFQDPFRGVPLEFERQASDISDLNDYVRPQAFSKHRDTLARVPWPRKFDEQSDDEGFHSDDDDCYETCSLDVETTVEGGLSMASCLPAEVLHEIFSLLQPCDFEAARHACRSWFVASLDRKLAHMMLRRAGCYSAFLADLNRIQTTQSPYNLSYTVDPTNQHWLASKRLATESRLSAAWHGSSLQTAHGHSSSRLSVRQTVDFTHIMSKAALQNVSDSNTFTVSTCGKFVLVTSDCDILVYAIEPGNATFEPLVRLVAESKVLAVSMDTSARRFAVAALLEGRMGACWEIDDIVLNGAVGNLYSSLNAVLESDQDQYTLQGVSDPMASTPSERDEISIIAEGVDIEVPQSIQFQQLDSPSDTLTTSSIAITPASPSTGNTLHADLSRSSVPVRTKPNAVYRNLGTKNDAPRSVAICPQRKCAAFGCRAGIELHWVDALTGADLNRWFPLAAPSDCLYFLPQRPGIDSAKKLRLISSASNPAVQARRNWHVETSSPLSNQPLSGRARARSMMKLFQGNRPSAASISNTNQHPSAQNAYQRMDCDHYRAIPLSDGQHMLFTDPVSGLLCLGSDAPLGGPTKLVRKACMVPPHMDGIDQLESPIFYTAASDLSWGVRVVAAYADGRLVLYNIPSDCFERLRHIRSSPEIWDEWNGGAGQSDLMMDAFISNRENNMSIAGSDENALFKSLQIDGALLGYVDADVEALSVDAAAGGLKTWVFHASGQATQMDIYVPRDHKMSSLCVGIDGFVHEKLTSPLPRAILKSHTNTPYNMQVEQQEDYFGSHVRFVGLDGCCDHRSPSMCGPMVHKHEMDYTDFIRDEGISMTPGASDDEDNDRPLQVELLTDWRAESLLRPYIVNVAWIDAH